MEKRGIGHHLDWIIGISLFILYILFVIVTLKPGVQPLQKGSTLVDIVQDRFMQNVIWKVTKVPLSITSSCSSMSKSYIKIINNYPNFNNIHTNMVDANGQNINEFEISSSNL